MKPLLKFIFAAELFALLIVLARCSSPNVKSTSNVDQEKTMTYFKNMLEESPFNLHFEMPTERWGRADDTTFFTQGHNADRSIEATIRYNPNDGEFYSVDLQLKKLPLDPTQSDVQVILDFTNKIDPLFANYFWRNKEGIFIDENKFVDTSSTSGKWCRYFNAQKRFVFYIDGDVNENNSDLKKHPEMRERILDAGNFLSIEVKNTNRGMKSFSSDCLVEK